MGAEGTGNAEAADRRILQVRIRADSFESLRPLILEGLDAGCRPHPVQGPEGGVSLDAYVADEDLAQLKEKGFELEVVADVTAGWRERQAEIGRGDRFEGGQIAPRGLGLKTGGRRTGQ